MWLAARDSEARARSLAGIEEFLGEPFLLADVDACLGGRRPRLTTAWATSVTGSTTAIFARVAGPQGAMHRDRIHGTPGPRWFPLGSPITRVHGDASMYVGGLRAVLLQTLQPQAMTAVAEHSGYRGDIWGRLARTSRFLAVTTFGTADDAQQAVDVVRAIHERVVGTMPDGTPYTATDPHLLEWVHIAEIHSFLLSHQRYGARPLDQAGRDEYVAQTAFVARKLGVLDPPTTEAELEAALARFRPELTVTDHAREAVSYLIWHPDLPLPARLPVRRAGGRVHRPDAASGPASRSVCRWCRWSTTGSPRPLGTLATAHHPLGDDQRPLRRGQAAGRAREGRARARRRRRMTPDDLAARWPLSDHHDERDALVSAYGDPVRGYHDLLHLTEVLDRIDELTGAGARAATVSRCGWPRGSTTGCTTGSAATRTAAPSGPRRRSRTPSTPPRWRGWYA